MSLSPLTSGSSEDDDGSKTKSSKVFNYETVDNDQRIIEKDELPRTTTRRSPALGGFLPRRLTLGGGCAKVGCQTVQFLAKKLQY